MSKEGSPSGQKGWRCIAGCPEVEDAGGFVFVEGGGAD